MSGEERSGGDTIDPRAIEAIRALQRPGKPDLLGRVVALFEKDAPALVETMERALESGEIDRMRDAAHTLKSSSAQLGALTLSARCRDLEHVARDGNLPACVALADGLGDDLGEALAALRPFLDRAA